MQKKLATLIVLVVMLGGLLPAFQIVLPHSFGVTSPTASECQSEEFAQNVNSTIDTVRSSSAFAQMAQGREYPFYAFGVVVGSSCSKELLFVNATFGTIEAIFAADGSSFTLEQLPHSGFNYSTNTANWSGYEHFNQICVPRQPCSNGQISSAQTDFTVLANQIPPDEDSACCSIAEWAGMADLTHAGDNNLVQGGVAIVAAYLSGTLCDSGGKCYGSPVFWIETLPQPGSATYWTNNCIPVNTGDVVNTTIDIGSFNGYNTELVFGDNDPHATCSLFWFIDYSRGGEGYAAFSESILEAAPNPVYCGGVCQLIQWGTTTFKSYYKLGLSGSWYGFDQTSCSGYCNSYVNGYYIQQGLVQNTKISITSSSAFSEQWLSSEQ